MDRQRWAVAPTSSTEATSVGQVVAYNIWRARTARDMTQEDLAERLREVTGAQWPRPAVTMIESAWKGSTDRIRTIDANQIAAFAVALEVPVAWFFMPPLEGEPRKDRAAPEFVCDGKGRTASGLSAEQLCEVALSRTDGPGETTVNFPARIRLQAPRFYQSAAGEQASEGGDMSNPQ